MLALQKLGLTLTALSAVALLTPATHAQTTTSIPVTNFSFENSGLGGNTPTGWTYNGPTNSDGSYATGVQNNYPATDGTQYAFIYAQAGGYDLEQNVGTAILGDTYTLNVDVLTQGLPTDTPEAFSQISLTNGNSSYKSTPINTAYNFVTQTVTFTATSASPLIIHLLLTDANGAPTTAGQGDFDNVRLTQIAPAPAAAPEPSAWAGLAVGALGLGALSLRARRRTLSA